MYFSSIVAQELLAGALADEPPSHVMRGPLAQLVDQPVGRFGEQQQRRDAALVAAEPAK